MIDRRKIEVWPGPMEGIYREEFVAAALSLDLVERWMTPFIRITENIPSASKLKKAIGWQFPCGMPITVQLMGNNPELLAKCGNFILENFSVSGINLNLGCPSMRVVKHGAGGGLLKEPQRAIDLCAAVAEQLPGDTFSVKLRSGYDDPDDMEILLPGLTDIQGITKIFFHYRTVCEGYSAVCREERIKRFIKAVKLCGNVPVIINGDIDDVGSAVHLMEITGASGVMSARSWLRDPFLLKRFSGDAPDAENGRNIFFSEIRKRGVRGGALIETAKMLWGVNDPRFREILADEGMK